MKKLFTLFAIAALVCVGCSDDYDDSGLQYRVGSLESRVAKLEQLCKQMNTNISALQTIVEALQNNDYVTGVAPVTSNGETIGYTITFTKSAPITIYHGQNGKDGANGADGKDGHTPVIGVRQDTDGVYYWTLDGDWLLDNSGNKIKAEGRDGQNGADGKDGADGQPGKDGQDGAPGKDGQDGKDGLDGAPGADGKDGENGKDGVDGKDGITPQLKIEDGYWFVSTDNGTTWTNLGKATGEDGTDGKDGIDGDSMFRSVTQDEENVYFTLAEGVVISVPKVNASEDIKFEDSLVKALCIANWDTDYDGEFSRAEAAAVTALGEVFRGTKIRSFNELVYFTGLTAIDDYAFDGCSELCSVDYPTTVTTIGTCAFCKTGLINILIPETIRIINEAAFSQCKQVQRIDICYPVIINSSAFAWTTGKVYINSNLPNNDFQNGTFRNSQISKLIVGDDVEIIGDYAFSQCPNLSEIKFASNGKLHTIGVANFFQSAITTFEIPESLQTWGEYAFTECNSLKTITGRTTHFQVIDNVLMYITGGDNKIILYPPGRNNETYTIPNYIKIIGNSAFRNCNNLKTVVFPEYSYIHYNVSEIGEMAFYNCKNLESVPYFEKTMVASISRSAFCGCESLESITLPPTVETIAESAFSNCSSLTSIYCKAQTPPTIDSTSFKWSQCTLYVATGCKDAYAAADYWKNAKEIIETDFSELN